MSKKILMLVGVAVLVAAIGVGSTLAYMTAATEGTNVVTIGDVKIRVYHDKSKESQIKLMPNVPVDTNEFTVENTGSNPAYIRVKLTPRNLSSVEAFVKEDGNWTKYNDYVYYRNALEPKRSVTFTGQVKLPADMKNGALSGGLDLDIVAEALQTEHVDRHNSGSLNGYPRWPDVPILENTK